MKTDTLSNRSISAKKSKRLRCLDLTFEGHDLVFKNEDLDNGRLPHGGYRGSKNHPMGIYSWDRGPDYQRQLQVDLQRLVDSEVAEQHGSPHWTLEAHRQPTHSGESPLIINKFLSPSKHEQVNGTDRWTRVSSRAGRSSAPPCPQGGKYYRPNRMHQYLTATELRNAAGNDDVLRYGRPTRTTLLRARQRVNHPAESFTSRRQLEHRMDELKNASVFSNPKEITQHQTEVEGETFHSFLTGARYNRAHHLDSKSLTQYGVYMPRDNPLGCFVIGHRDILDTASVPPESPRSEAGDGPSPVPERRRPLTAPSYGRKSGGPVPPSPREAWGDASSSLHITNGDNKHGDNDDTPVMEDIRAWSPRLNVKGRIMSLSTNREGPTRFECKLPRVQGTSLSRPHKVQEATDDGSEANQPPPSLADHSAPRDDHHLPVVEPEVEGDRTLHTQQKEPEEEVKPEAAPLLDDSAQQVTVSSLCTPEPAAIREDTRDIEEGEGEEGGGREDGMATEEGVVTAVADADETEETATDDVAAESDVTAVYVTEDGGQTGGEERWMSRGQGDEVKFFMTEEGAVTDHANTDTQDSGDPDQQLGEETVSESGYPHITEETLSVEEGTPSTDRQDSGEPQVREEKDTANIRSTSGNTTVRLNDAVLTDDPDCQSDVLGAAQRQPGNEDSEQDDIDQAEGHAEPLKVIVSHVERSKGAP
ncbi:uncharacterized protein [Littorina saxatilis]|uniref:Uncharacterized protein n=1 Tax=Littorina saxatilis TaxID=31220 RepID=A0AAN9G157_9CAEN